jgi:hypothetical protein
LHVDRGGAVIPLPCNIGRHATKLSSFCSAAVGGCAAVERQPFTPPLRLCRQILPRFSTRKTIFAWPHGLGRSARALYALGDPMDIVFLAVLAVFLGLTLALVAGCAALERKK